MQMMELLRRGKPIYVLRYDIIYQGSCLLFAQRALIPVASALLKLMGQLHQCIRRQADKMLLSQPQLFFVHTCSFGQIQDTCRLRYCFQGNFLPAGWKFYQNSFCWNLDSQSPLSLISNLPSPSVVVDLRAKVSPCNGWRWGSISTSWQTSLNKFAMESRSSLCLMWVYPPFGQWRACATVKFSLHEHSDGIFTGSQP